MLIVVGLVLARDPPQMGPVRDESAVQELTAASPDPAFGDRVRARSTAVHGISRRSAETGAALTRRHSSAPVQGNTRYQQGSRDHPPDPVGHAWARPSTTSDLLGPGGPLTEDGEPSKSRSERFGEPLAPARFRPPYVRNHCYAGAHSGTL